MAAVDERPAEILLRLQQEAVDAGHSLPDPESGDSRYCALAFVAGGLNLAVNLTGIADVLDCPPLTPVPGTRPWLRGISNVRGKLCSVVDLGLFLGVSTGAAERAGKLLVVNPADLGCTLYVSRIVGLRYFKEDALMNDLQGMEAESLPCVTEVFRQDDCTWNVLSIEKLLSDERFLNIGGGF